MKKTSALNMAAAFLAKGAVLVGTDKADPKHMVFCLEVPKQPEEVLPEKVSEKIDEASLDAWETQWANDTLMVHARRYSEALQTLKSIVHSV